MIGFEVRGAIFDVDDTLLNNKGDTPGKGLHERSRLQAMHEIGRKHHIAALETLSPQLNQQAFKTASTHTLIGAIWNTFILCGIRQKSDPNPDDPLLQEAIAIKMALHEKILLLEGEPYPGAVDFVSALANNGLRDLMAVATTAYRRDLQIFFKKSGLDTFFPLQKVVSLENVIHAKPHPEAFNLAFQLLGLPEQSRKYVVAFEDNPRGVASAKSAGLYVCALSHIYSKVELQTFSPSPDYIADNFRDLSEFFGLHI